MNYITQDGFYRLSEELSHLWKVKRPEIVRAISTAAAEGDRSENAEYIYRKKELRETDRKIRYLERHLKDIQVVRDKPRQRDKVFFGASVLLEDEMGDQVRYRIVGGLEVRLEENEISVASPMAKALLGKALDDDVVVSLPDGRKVTYTLLDIVY
ncbi:transcription elongation factor GreB [Hydrogenovibrio thermophilus]|uniref:Transcription elongation factor GreB n=1 Tax=Hydrogenovibrio thermophilus TaxID=265883 RepID=A0A410H1G1_9GAMM|nr:transcription elongation factor GreB [Hydrogenovibrio thermophilus]QAB14747.1 transcription elongation factor GreB [Hydrogenovibrio thermophilus]